MITKEEVLGAGTGIGYAINHAQPHIADLAGTLEAMTAGVGAAMSDEEFRGFITGELATLVTQIEELYGGLNSLHDRMKAGGI